MFCVIFVVVGLGEGILFCPGSNALLSISGKPALSLPKYRRMEFGICFFGISTLRTCNFDLPKR
jgi:hypothetical protein